ncbi:MAG: type IV pilus assembly protein PilM, partial [Candidatus Doudnabacteria bacterium]|nr:type IV pilus assembly protein PilM [Candidatus Doudnabacteria bacterium]
MLFGGLFSKKDSILGIDIGTANIKIAQISHKKGLFLDTYGIVNIAYQLGGKNEEMAIQEMAKILKNLVEKAGVSTKRCVISFPNSAVFTSVVDLPQMTEGELVTAVEYEAKKYVPLSLSEVDLSWTIVSGGHGSNLKVLLTAVPKQVTRNYMKVFDLAGLEPEVGEIEALALIRSLIGNGALNCVIIDIGAKSTGLNIIENGFLRLSRNLNVGGDTITNKIAESLRVSKIRAEQFKKDFGVSSATFIPDTIK